MSPHLKFYLKRAKKQRAEKLKYWEDTRLRNASKGVCVVLRIDINSLASLDGSKMEVAG